MKAAKLATAATAVALVFSFINGQLMVNRMQREAEAAQQQVQQQQESNEELRNLLATGDEDAYVERIARDRLGYAKPGERIFIDITGE